MRRPSARDLGQARSLAYHRAVAQRLARDGRLLARAKERLSRWRTERPASREYTERWAEVLERPLADIVAYLDRDDEEAAAMRQASPFAGALPPRERWALWRDVRARWEQTHGGAAHDSSGGDVNDGDSSRPAGDGGQGE